MNIAPSYYSPSPSPPPLPFLPDSIHPSTNPNLKIAYSSDQQSTQNLSSSFNGPYMGVVLVVLLVTFFLMAAFSVYVRRYAFALSGEVVVRPGQGPGLDRAAIDGLPIVLYHRTKEDAAAAAVAVAEAEAHEWSHRPDCVVCLTDFQEAEKLRLLPRCEHCFHPECIDMWLFSHSTCPLCRRSLLPPSNDVCISVQAPPPPLAVAPSHS